MARSKPIDRRTLTAADYKSIGGLIEKKIKDGVPKIIRQEFADIGLPVETTEQQVRAQEFFAEMRRLQKGVAKAEGTIWNAVLNGFLKCGGAIILAGIGALVGVKFFGGH